MVARRNQELIDSLFSLRDELRRRFIIEKKLICTDEAVQDMAKKKPLRLSDFLAIPGLDSDFLENYAHLFLSVISNYKDSSINKVKVSKEASVVLDRYKDRLTNISKTNPNLYLGYIAKNSSYDLFNEDNVVLIRDFLSLKKDSIKFSG